MYLKPKGKIRDLVKTTLQTYISEWITDFFVWWYEWSKMPFLSAQLLWASIYCVLLQSCFYIIWWPPHSHAEFFTSLYVWELFLFPCSLLLPQMSQPCTLLFFLLYINVVVGFFLQGLNKRKSASLMHENRALSFIQRKILGDLCFTQQSMSSAMASEWLILQTDAQNTCLSHCY